jgi:xylulokinase
MLFAGLDVSTQSCKLLVLDLDAAKIVFLDSVNYDHDLPEFNTLNGVIQGLPEGASESDPLMWIKAVNAVFEHLNKSEVPQDQIRCISVSGQQHGLVSLDKSGNLTRSSSKLWNDFSTLEECELLTTAIGGLDQMIEEVGNSQRTGYTAAKIFHMFRHEPELFKNTDTFFLVHNYINWYLTGGVRIMEPGDTSGMALWHPAKGTWSQRVIRAIDEPLRDKLPEIKPSDQTIGVIAAELVSKYGFHPECTIDAGSGDNMYGAIGTGNIEPGIITISLGTSGTAYTFLEKAYVDDSGEIAAFCDSTGHYLPLLCVSNLANGYNQILRQFNLDHAQFNDLIKKTKPGNEGRVLIPWYEGERTPDVPLAAPVYFGFGLEDFTPEKLSRAVLEGHILNLYDGFQRLPVKAKEIRLTGGLAQSEAWRQTIADIFETDVVPVAGEGAALGAALHAAWVWVKENGRSLTLSEVVKPFIMLEENKRRNPVATHADRYKLQKDLFHSLSERMRVRNKHDPFALRAELSR